MPQMMPLNWVFLYFYVLLLLVVVVVLFNSFYFILKISSLKLKKKMFNWMW